MVEGGRVVDQDVDFSELVLDLLENVADLLPVGHVHLDGESVATHLADLLRGRVRVHPTLRNRNLREHAARGLCRLLQLGIVLDQDVGDDHVGARLGQRQRVLPPQSARGPGHDGNLA